MIQSQAKEPPEAANCDEQIAPRTSRRYRRTPVRFLLSKIVLGHRLRPVQPWTALSSRHHSLQPQEVS